MLANHQDERYGRVLQTLAQQRQQLIGSLDHHSPAAFLRAHAHLLDDYFRDSFTVSMVGPRMKINQNPYAVIALGGYGREEQCVHSDVDLLFLFKKRIPPETEELIREMVYPLWDIGLEVGYATRTIKECLRLAAQEFEILTPILDARFICGNSLIYTDLIENLRTKLIKKRAAHLIDWLVSTNRERHTRFGDSTYLLEPNLKEGQGGLRDYHTLLWISRINFNLKQPRDLEYYGYLSHAEYEGLQRALAFIWDVRNRLHLLAGRKTDQLHFESQLKLAEILKYPNTGDQQAVELFLGDLHANMEFMKRQHLMVLFDLGYTHKSKYQTKHLKHTAVEGLHVHEGHMGILGFDSAEAVVESPGLLMKIFEESARLKSPLGTEAKRIVTEFGYLVDDAFRASKTILKSFERILSIPAPTFNVMREMLDTGLLSRYLPPLQGISNRIQYDEYHLYPVDKHSLRTLQIIKNFGSIPGDRNTDLYQQLYKELKNRKLVLWAALLHDIGKGTTHEDHAIAGAETARALMLERGYAEDNAAHIAFLIQHHLLLIKTATRRDIHDEETALVCARMVKDPERLKMLYLLTVADSSATGPSAWGDWTSTLLRDFFFKVLNILEKGELASREAVETMAGKIEAVLASAETPEARLDLENLCRIMSPRYLLARPPEEILKDIDTYHQVGDAAFAWEIIKDIEARRREVRICAHDRPGLFSQIAGVFTLNGLNILAAQIFTWRNNMALDIFELEAPADQIFEDERWQRAEQNLHDVLAGKLDLAAALDERMATYRRPSLKLTPRPQRVKIDNDSSSFFTIIEVFADDYIGLLYAITDTIFKSGLDIWVAKISTKVDQVVDVFYVRDFDAQKVDEPEQVAAIETAILERIDRPRTPLAP